MTFKDVTRWVAIGGLILEAAITSWKITKLNKEHPSHDAYKELLYQRMALYVLAIPLLFNRIYIYFSWYCN